MRRTSYLVLKKENHAKGSYTFFKKLTHVNSFITKHLTRSSIVLNTMMAKESKSFTDISIFSLRSWSQIMLFILFSVMVFTIVKFLAILLQVKAGQNYDERVIQWKIATNRLNNSQFTMFHNSCNAMEKKARLLSTA